MAEKNSPITDYNEFDDNLFNPFINFEDFYLTLQDNYENLL